MNGKHWILSALVAPALTVFGEQEVINKTFDAKPGGTLTMNVDRGTIKVETSKGDKVEVEVVRELRRGNAEDAREVFEQHQIEFAQEADGVRIEAHGPGFNGLRNLFNNYSVEYTISVPAKFNVDLKTSGGNVSVGDLDGKVSAKTTGGSITLGATTGEIMARSSGGNIKIASTKSNVEVNTTGGSITIGHVDGNLTAKTSGGNITLERIKGSIDAITTGGSIKIASAGGAVKAKSSGGNVSAELTEGAPGECSLKTTGGSVKLTLPEKIAADLEASTTGGRVSSDFDGEFNKQRTKLVAKLNGGGPEMKLSTSGGNVDIRKK